MLVSLIVRLFDGAQCQIDPEYTGNAASSNSKTLIASTKLHGITFQKTVIVIVTAVENLGSNMPSLSTD